MNYCCLAMYMIYITLNFFQLLCMIGLTIQNGTMTQVYANGFNTNAFQFTLSVLFLVYYAMAWPLCFHAFKEFKAMLQDYQGTEPNFIGNMTGGFGQQQVGYRQDNRDTY